MNILICDDSGFARKQMTRSLPSDWDVEITYAADGREGLDIIKSGKAEVVFLDLNMPEMDGYEVLQHIQSNDLPAMSIVVSGDVQEEAYTRVKRLGALDFIQKPVSSEEISRILSLYGLHESHTNDFGTTGSGVIEESAEPGLRSSSTANSAHDAHQNKASADLSGSNQTLSSNECYQELANVALGRAVKLLAQHMGTFVEMSIPHANDMDLSELQMALQHVSVNEKVTAVSQGFGGGGITGEALLMLNDSNIRNIATLLKFEGEITQETHLELTMDISNILIGACLAGLSDQLDLRLSQGHPQIFDQYDYVGEILVDKGTKPALTLEMGCSIAEHHIDIELLLMFTADSIENLNNRLNYMVS